MFIRDTFARSIVVASLLAGGCSPRWDNDSHEEKLVFASLGDKPFADSIEVVRAEGGAVQAILIPQNRKSYQFASGYSLSDRLVILVHEATQDGTNLNRLYFYYTVTKHWELATDEDGNDGSGVLSPDNQTLAFIRHKKDEPGGLWLVTTRNKQPRLLMRESVPSEWYASPSWRPNTSQIGLIELTRSNRGILTQVVLFNVDSLLKETLIAPVGGFCFSPDGSQVGLITGNGIEVMSINTSERKVIAPWGSLNGRIYKDGGMSWSQDRGLLAIALFDQSTGHSEILTFPLDGGKPKRIYNSRGWVRGLSFIRR